MAGIYRRSVMLASERNAMLDDGMGFSLVQWRPLVEQRLQQQLAAKGRDGGEPWEMVRQQGLTLDGPHSNVKRNTVPTTWTQGELLCLSKQRPKNRQRENRTSHLSVMQKMMAR